MDQKPALAPCEYKTGKTLGQGSYATVKESVHIKTGDRFAVKIISKKLMAGKEHLILNEIDILKKVSKGHPNIVTLHDYFETPNNLYLVLDLCTGGELFDRICERGSFYEEDAAHIVRTLVDAVAYLHSQNIVHRDIKPENLLLRSKDSFEIVIADFGLSKLINSEKLDLLRTTCGTPGYMPPEVIKKAGHGKPVDLWCVGVLTYFLLCGYMPFEPNNESASQEVKNILAGKYDFEDEIWEDVSDQAKDFISHLLVLEPSQRLTAAEALKHPWLDPAFFTAAQTTETADTPLVAETPVYNTPVTALSGKFPSPTKDLLPNVRERFNARRTFIKAIDVIKAVNKLSHSPHVSHVDLGFADKSRSPGPGTTANSLAPSVQHSIANLASATASGLDLNASGSRTPRSLAHPVDTESHESIKVTDEEGVSKSHSGHVLPSISSHDRHREKK